MTVESFLRSVWELQPKGTYCISSKSQEGKFTDEFFEDIEDAAEYAEEIKKDHNVYFAPIVFSTDRRRKSCAMPSNVLYADLDEAHPSSCFIQPQIAWKTSKKRYSCIWLLDQSLKREEFEKLNKIVTYRCSADKSGWDITQVLRLPGTNNFKYPDAPAASIMWNKPHTFYSPLQFSLNVNATTLAILERKDTSGCDRSAVLYKLEHDLKEQGLTQEEIFNLVSVSAWNKYNGRINWEKQLKAEIKKVFDNGVDLSVEEEILEDDGIKLVSYVEIIEEEVRWLWKPYLPQGKLVLVEGDPAEGKSWFTSAIIAAISVGGTILDNPFELGNNIILNAEDDPKDTIKPRLRKLGTDFTRVFDIQNSKGKVINLHDENDFLYILSILENIKPKILVIDPLVAFIGDKIDIHKANQIRYIMARLKRLAEASGTTIIVVRHLAKTERENVLYRGLGSIDMSASVRSQIMIGRSKTNKYEKIACQIKLSVERTGLAIKYYLDSRGGFQWLGYIDFDIQQWAPVSLEKQKDKRRKVAEHRARAEIIDDNIVKLHPFKPPTS